MASNIDQPASDNRSDNTAESRDVNVVRILFPSTLGSLGIEFRERTISRLVVVPSPSERRKFTPFKNAKRSDFIDETLGRLSEYLAGARRRLQIDIDLSPHDLDDTSRMILEATRQIPYGERRSFQRVAANLGIPDSYRLVRSVLVNNPVPIILPCHRVVPRKGGAGSYVGSPKKKEWLLKLEEKVTSSLDS